MSDPIEFVDKLPDARGGRKSTIKTDILAQLRAHPGQWAIIRRYNGEKKPNAATGWIKEGTTDIEARQRTIDGETRLYARAVER